MFNKKTGLVLAIVMMITVFMAACQPQTVEVVKEVPVEVTRVVTETVTEAGQEVEVTRIVTEEMVVTAVPEEAAAVSMTDASPDTYVTIQFGDVDTLDPALA
jgi:hypothetical protein